MKLLPIGIQSFEKMIEDDYIYVDKTKHLYNIIKQGTTYFLSRPRRFGKSLTISTLEAIFLGKKELFKDLWIYKSDYEWKEYPVIRLDMSMLKNDSVKYIEEDLKIKMSDISKSYNVELDMKGSIKMIFGDMIDKLNKKVGEKVVVLIDEYDKPILDNINRKEEKDKIRDLLRGFYGVLKSQDENIRFVFLTGITKFSKVSVFSGLNNLNDLTMDIKYSTMLGYTQEELEFYFKEYIEEYTQKEGKKENKLLDDIKDWYNGFRFTKDKEKVYNPFSTLLLFNKKEFRSYWFETATPTFLIKLIKKMNFPLFDTENQEVSEDTFSVFDIERMNILSLLYQTGYFTIQGYNEDRGLYRLGYPNREVEFAFTRNIIQELRGEEKFETDRDLREIEDALYDKDIEAFIERFKIFISSIPYTTRSREEEKYYQTIFYTILRCLGIRTQVEVTTNIGRIDAVIELKAKIYILEFKLNGSKEEALEQIKEKKYYEKYKSKNKEIILIGAEIDKEKRNIGDWQMEGI